MTLYSRPVSQRPPRQQVSGRRALAAVLTLVLLMAGVVVVQALLADRTGIRHRAPVVRYGDAGASGVR